MKRITYSLLLIMLFSVPLTAKIAIIPYKVANSSSSFPQSSGSDYAKLLYVTASLTKDARIVSPETVTKKLTALRIDPAGKISRVSLQTFGKTYHYDYILLGTVYRSKRQYISKSIFYSVHLDKIINKTRLKASNLLNLAAKEISEVFVQYKPRTFTPKTKPNFDLAVILDTSYSVKKEWNTIKSSVINFATKAIDTYGANTRVYLLPFSSQHSISDMSFSKNSIIRVKNKLRSYKPKGRTSISNFKQAMRYAIAHIKWRTTAKKCVIIIANSKLNRAHMSDHYAVAAKNKKIKIYTLSLGRIPKEKSELLKRLASITGASHRHVSYHQKIYDSEGKPLHLYYENNRLFRSQYHSNSWKNGLFKAYNDFFRKPRDFLNEVYYDFTKITIDSANLGASYKRISKIPLLKKSTQSNNIKQLVNLISTGYFKNNLSTKITGKVLLQNNNISFWVSTHSNKHLQFFKNQYRKKQRFAQGIITRRATGTAYGLTFIPVVSHIILDDIPKQLLITIRSIIKKRGFYTRQGITYPPVWFVRVRVLKIIDYNRVRDIRD